MTLCIFHKSVHVYLSIIVGENSVNSSVQLLFDIFIIFFLYFGTLNSFTFREKKNQSKILYHY